MNSRRLVVNGHHYEAQVAGDGEPILLLHGFSGDKSTWHDLCPALQHEYHLIVIDILGHGGSDKPADSSAFRMERVAINVICLLDKLNVFQCHLVGYSMGGRLALYLAIANAARFRSLILESASPGLDDPQERNQRRRLDNQLANKIEMKGIEWFVDYWQGLPIWHSQRFPWAPTYCASSGCSACGTIHMAWRTACVAWAPALNPVCGNIFRNFLSRPCCSPESMTTSFAPSISKWRV